MLLPAKLALVEGPGIKRRNRQNISSELKQHGDATTPVPETSQNVISPWKHVGYFGSRSEQESLGNNVSWNAEHERYPLK